MRVLKPKSGFSLPELMISLGISAVLAVVVVAAIFIGRESRQIIRTQLEMKEEVLSVSKTFQVMLDEMVRINGATSAAFATINRVPDAEPSDASESDAFELMAGLYSTVSIPVSFVSATQKFRISRPVDANSLSQDTFSIFKDVIGNRSRVPFLTISNRRFTNMFENPASATVNADSIEFSVPSALIAQLEEYTGQLANNFATLSMARKIRIQHVGSRIRMTPEPLAGEQVTEIGSRIQQMQMRLHFYKFDQTRDVLIPEQPLPRLMSTYSVGGITCGPTARDRRCVTAGDVGAVEITLKLQSADQFNRGLANEVTAMGPEWSLENGYLTFTSRQMIYPKNLWASNEIPVSKTADPSCSATNLKSQRCQQTCASKFSNNAVVTNPNTAPDDWVGFRPGSPYCKCITTDGFAVNDPAGLKIKANDGPFDQAMLVNRPVHSWNDLAVDGGRDRARACFEAFGCSYWRWSMNYFMDQSAVQNPEAVLACRCINPTMVNRDTSGNDTGQTPVGPIVFAPNAKYQGLSTWQYTGPLVPGDVANGSGVPWIDGGQLAGNDRNLFCDGQLNQMPNTCLNMSSKLNSFTSPNVAPWGTSGTNNRPVNPWNTCSCRSGVWNPLFAPSGQSVQSTFVNVPLNWQVNWPNVCNHNFVANGVTCPNTGRNDAGVLTYMRRDVAESDPRFDAYGLTARDEKFCRCSNASIQAGQRTEPTADYRFVKPVSGRPNLLDSIFAVAPEFGTVNCAEFGCSLYSDAYLYGGDMSCCVPKKADAASSDVFDVELISFQSRLAAWVGSQPGANPRADIADYRQYCFRQTGPDPRRAATPSTDSLQGRYCITPYSNAFSANRTQTEAARLYMFNVGSVSQLPDWCGGEQETDVTGAVRN